MAVRNRIWLILLITCLSCATDKSGELSQGPATFPIRFAAPGGELESGLDMLYVRSPWDSTQYMALDFPEHCWGKNFSGLSTDARGTARPNRWQFNGDSTRAEYTVTAQDGSLFRATARADSMAVGLELEIENRTALPITEIRILICTRPHRMSAFLDTNFVLTEVAVEGRPLAFGRDTHFNGTLPERMPPAWVMNLKGGIDNRTVDDMGWFSEDWGRRQFRLVEEEAEPALIGVHAREDEQHWLATIWEPSRVLFSNPHIPCIHSDPVPPDCPPGEATRANGIVFFHQGNFQSLITLAESCRDGHRKK